MGSRSRKSKGRGRREWKHGRMERGGHGLPKKSLGLAMPNPSTLCGRATPKMTVSWMARLQGGQPPAVFYPIGYPIPYAHEWEEKEEKRLPVGLL
jgi:hypothetical protein